MSDRDPRLARLENTLMGGWGRGEWRVFLFLADRRWSRRYRWRVTARYWRNRFRVWALLPGDRVDWFDRDMSGEVVTVKPSTAEVAVVSGFAAARFSVQPEDFADVGERCWFTKRELESTWPRRTN